MYAIVERYSEGAYGISVHTRRTKRDAQKVAVELYKDQLYGQDIDIAHGKLTEVRKNFENGYLFIEDGGWIVVITRILSTNA